MVTPVSQGTTTITATSVDNGAKTASSLITVAPQVAVTGVSVDPTQCSFLAINETQLLTATVTPSWADNKAVNWYSSDDGVAEVDKNGLVTAKGFGTATITVATVDGNHTATCAVEVMTHVASINLEPTSKNFTAAGQTAVLSLQILPTTATNQMVSWVSSNNNVATVTQTDADPSTGTITALVTATGLGTATITVTSQDGFHQATCAVSCYEAVTGIKINTYSYSNPIERVYKSSTLGVRATTIPASAYNKNVTWTTGDPSVATVSPENSTTTSTVTLQCVSHGTTTLRVTSEEDANFYDEVPVNCEMAVFAQDGTAVTTSPVSTSYEAVSLPCPSAFPTRMTFPSMTTLHGGVSASTWFRVFGATGISHTTPPGMNYQSKAAADGTWIQSSVNSFGTVAWFCVE
ncbi:hypothetical protein FACS189440_17610 [Bacteroidia bacterium]|nr:hypothetical protein FACS189423_08680 [Bacteroidia bacterium]GHT50344.1 hypothetical protein FACS189440_17610 [Bacteroidia bacterium]